MAHSYRAHYYHLIWSTKNRVPLIGKEIQSPLYAYIGGITKNKNGALLCAGGTDNHIHLLIGLTLPDKFSDFVRDIKANSSLWLSKNLSRKQSFSWQEGYGSFSVSYSSLDKVIHYIENQEAHHRVITFEEEYRQIIRKHKIKYDERFLF